MFYFTVERCVLSKDVIFRITEMKFYTTYKTSGFLMSYQSIDQNKI